MNIMIRGLAVILLCLAGSQAMAQARFAGTLTLPDGNTVVVAEGESEARSLGSFSVRLYQAATRGEETTFFQAGLIRARDGAVERILLADIDNDDQPEVVVVVRSVGSGGYLSAHAFSVADGELALGAEVQGLAAGADVVAALRDIARRTP